MPDNPRPILNPSSIAQFFNQESCPMFLSWKYDTDGQRRLHTRNWEENKISPILAKKGREYEREQVKSLRIHLDDAKFIGNPDSEWLDFDEEWEGEKENRSEEVLDYANEAASNGDDYPPIVLHHPYLSGEIGAYEVEGKADIVVFEPTNNNFNLYVFEVKLSSEERVHHRLQATIYTILLKKRLSDLGITPDQAFTKIITKENRIQDGGLKETDDFDISCYETQLRIKLEEGGKFDQLILEKDFVETRYWIDSRCSQCGYEPMCVTRAVESKGLELLGITPGTQEVLEQLGVRDLEDFANLYDQPGEDSSHLDFSPLEPRDEELVQKIRKETNISEVQKKSQIAYRFLGEIDERYSREGPDFFPHELQGAGRNLLTDQHPPSIEGEDTDYRGDRGPDYPSGSLIRIYLFTQHDPIQNRLVLLGGLLENTSSGRQETVSKLSYNLPDSVSEKDIEEKRLLKEFFSELSEKIRTVAPDISSDQFEEDEGFLHLYFYSYRQRQVLMEAVKRHPRVHGSRMVRTLLGLREEIDQEMVSILQRDFVKRQALRFPGLGIVQATAQYRDDGWFSWEREREDGSVAHFHEIFEKGLFDSTVRHGSLDGGIRLDHSRVRNAVDSNEHRLAEWKYPVKNRETSQIPSEYVWGVIKNLDPDDFENPEDIRGFLYRGSGGGRITREDLKLFAEHLCSAIKHIERGTRNKDSFVNKDALNIDDITELDFDERSLSEVSIEYQQLEYQTQRRERESYYRLPLEERVNTGKSLLFRCDDFDDEDRIIGRIITPQGEEYSPSDNLSIISSPLSLGSGSFIVYTRLDRSEDRPEDLYTRQDPRFISNSPIGIVDRLNRETGEITIKALGYQWPRDDEPYIENHRPFTESPEESGWKVFIGEEEEFIADPMMDKIVSSRAYYALRHSENNPIYQLLTEVYDGEREELPIEKWDLQNVRDYIERLKESNLHDPNPRQRRLIRDVDHAVVSLQGPPGTGKTSYAIAPTVLSRIHASALEEEDMIGIVSALSHDAVDEALEKTIEMIEGCPTESNLELIRICSSRGQGSDHENVENVFYNESDAAERIREIYRDHLMPGLDGQMHLTSNQILFFGTPASIRGFMNKVADSVGDADSVEDLMESDRAAIFDLVVVDEASMMDLPKFFLLTAFLGENGQVILAGDHRQMQPIQRHDWEREDRKPIEEHVPFLSALNFLRYLRGEPVDIEYLYRDPPELNDPDETIPVHRLEETHRLPEISAKMHTDLFYSQDGITLRSVGDSGEIPIEDLDIPEDETHPVSKTLNPENKVTLLLHNDEQATRASLVEQILVCSLIGRLPESYTGDSGEGSVGVVVPFRAQSSELDRMTPENVQVNTVEKFQGDEKEVMIISMTAADPGYVNQITEFLLDPNRFNVAASRMKQKLIVIASSSIFEASSNKVEDFEKQEPWKQFYKRMGGLDLETTSYRISKFLEGTNRRELEERLEEIEDENIEVKVLENYQPTY